jgi:cell division protein FtsW (lipid II flippase)
LAAPERLSGPGIDYARLRPRRAELGLVIMVAIVVVAAYALASLGQSASIPANLGPFLVWMLALIVLAHLATRRLARLADPVLLPLALLLNGIGYVMIARLGGDVRGGGDLAGLQATWTAVGIGAYIATLVLVPRVRMLQQYQYLLGLAGLGLLLLPLVPGVGREINGARIWVSLGAINFQPGEFAKIALALFFAAYLVDKRELLRTRLEARDLAPIALAWVGSLGVMVLERDLGSSLLFFALFVVLLWVAAERALFLLVGLGLFTVGAVFASWRFDHVADRYDIWLDPWSDPKGDGFQIVEASFALADGGLTGTGLGRGEPDRIPFVESDFIFAAIGEELGLAGSVAILMAYLLLIGAGLRIAVQAGRTFETLLATGLTTLLGFQAFIIVGGVLRVVPLTGITLPFVSYGGSSLVANYVLLALLVRMSDERRAELSRGDRR